jgi:hypothetical protein
LRRVAQHGSFPSIELPDGPMAAAYGREELGRLVTRPGFLLP